MFEYYRHRPEFSVRHQEGARSLFGRDERRIFRRPARPSRRDDARR